MTKATEYSAVNLLPELNIDLEKWNRMPSESEIERTAEVIGEKGNIKVIRVPDGDAALAEIKRIIPHGAEVMNGSSTTLAEIGFMDLLNSGKSGWENLRGIVTLENNAEKRNEIRRRSVSAEYFISGVNALAMTGEIVSCDATGSRVGAWLFAAKKLVLVSGVNKIVPTLSDALQRVKKFAYPLEDARAKRAQGTPSSIGKCVILANEKQNGRVTLILVNERLGF